MTVPEKPRGDPGGVKVRHLVVHIDKLLILGNDGVLWIRIIINSSICSHLNKLKTEKYNLMKCFILFTISI